MSLRPTLLQVQALSLQLGSQSILRGIDLSLGSGEVLALIGASGAGKSALLAALMGMAPEGAAVSGSLELPDQRVALADSRQLAALRGRTLALVPQDPARSLPVHRRVGALLREVLRLHRPELTTQQQGAAAAELMAAVGLPETILTRYPHTLSGGQGQRVLIALALAGEPTVLLADEPTSALDPLVAQGVLRTLAASARPGRAVLIVSHDLRACAAVADRIAVLNAGRLVEVGSPEQILCAPRDPYVRALVAAGTGGHLTPAPRQGSA